MNKKGLLGTIIIAIIIILALVGTLIYFQLKKEGVQLSSGDFQIDIKYNSTEKGPSTITGGTILEINETESDNQIIDSEITEENITN